MKVNKKYIILLVLCILGTTIVLYTNPQHLSPTFLAAPLLIFTIVVYWTLLLVAEKIRFSPDQKLSKKAKLTLALVIAIPALLILLQSIGQLTLRDVITLVLIVVVLGFYISKVSFVRR